MIEHIWTVVCEKSLLDKNSNNVSLISCLERITVRPDEEFHSILDRDGRVVVPLMMSIVNLWHSDKPNKSENGAGRFQIIDADGEEMLAGNLPVQFEPGKRRLRVTNQIAGFAVSKPGEYRVRIYLGKKKVADVPIEVVFMEEKIEG